MNRLKQTLSFLTAVTLVFFAVLAASGSALAAGDAADADTGDADQPAFDGYIVKMADDDGLAILEDTGLEPIDCADGYYLAETSAEAQAAADTGLVEYIEPNYILELLDDGAQALSDPYYGQQWALEQIGFSALYQAGAGYDGSGVTVAVIDSGIYAEHEDLASVRVSGYNFLGSGTSDDVKNAYYRDQSGHGTFVAGIIAAQCNNGKGIAGVSDGVNILMLRCFSASGSSTYGYSADYDSKSGTVAVITSALGYAVEQGADVINMSFGGTAASLSQTLAEAIENAAASGAILVAAAGNAGQETYYWPASFPSVISVAALDEDGGTASYSQHNSQVDAAAPGSNLVSLGNRDDEDGYTSGSGTSFSAPIVAALAAVAKQVDGELDTYDFRELLKASVNDAGSTGYDNYYGYGTVDAAKLLDTFSAQNNLVYVLNGEEAALPQEYATGYTIDRQTGVTLPVPTWTGHTFLGWYDNADFTGDAVAAVPKGSVGTLTYYARWELTEATAPGPAASDIPQGAASPASYDGLTAAVTYTADKAALQSWFTGNVTAYTVSHDGGGAASVADGALTYTPAAADAGKTVTLSVTASNMGTLSAAPAVVGIAVSGIPVSDSALVPDAVQYDRNTGGNLEVGALFYGNTLTALSCGDAALRAGEDYAVTGQDELTEERVTLSASYLNTLSVGSHTLTFTFSAGRGEGPYTAALTLTVFDSATCTVTFMNGTAQVARITDVSPGGTVTPPAQPIKTGYTFRGWYTGTDGTGTEFTAATAVSADITVYADWEEDGNGSGSAGGGGGGIAITAPTTADGAYTAQEILALLTDDADAAVLSEKEGAQDICVAGAGVAALTGAGKGLIAAWGAGSLELSASALGALGAGETDTLTLELALAGAGDIPAVSGITAKADTLILKAAVTLTDGSAAKNITEFPDGITLTLALGEGFAGRAVRILQLHEREDGGCEVRTHTVLADADGRVTLELTALSLFLAEKIEFDDLHESDWYYEPIQYVVGSGLFSGVTETVFDPNGIMTRAMLATVLWRLAGSPETVGDAPFADLRAGAYYEDAVAWAAAAGIVSGYGDGLFAPDAPVTREQVVSMLWAYAQTAGLTVQGYMVLGERFTDADTVSDWAEAALGWAVDAGLVSGITRTTLAPQNTATRAEVAAILARYCRMLQR